MAGTDFRMPGAYQLEGSNAAGQVLSPRLFRPPMSPSSSSYNLAKSTGSLYSDASTNSITPAANAKRKRAQDRGKSPMHFDGEDDGMGFAHTKYTLAGRIDTPGSAQHDHDNTYSDADYRRALGTKKAPEEFESPATRHTSIFPRTEQSAHSMRWRTFALRALGGVVGKVWQFCTAGAFRGFYAGGGNGYHMDGKAKAKSGNSWSSEHDLPNSGHDTPSDPVPGDLPRSDYMPYMSEHDGMSTREASPGLTPSAKRRQTGEPDDLGRNWVMVEEAREGPSRRHTSSSKPGDKQKESKARNRKSVPGASAATNRRINTPVSRLEKWTPSSCNDGTTLRISHAGSPKLSAREPASFASSRSPGSRIPVPVHSSSGKPSVCASSVSQPSNLQRQLPPSPATRPRNRTMASAASGRSVPRWRGTIGARLDVDDIQASPRLDAEAKKLAQRKLAAEREADARVDYMNARLGDMIRQCKEALGTKIEVYGPDGGTGCMDDGD